MVEGSGAHCVLLIWLSIWFSVLLFLKFSLNDLWLIGLWIIAVIKYCIGGTPQDTDFLILLAGVISGRATAVLLGPGAKGEKLRENELNLKRSDLSVFLLGLTGLLAFSSWWQLDKSAGFYHGPRWMGLWNNPNLYGTLMSVGVVLAMGLLAERLIGKSQRAKSDKKAQCLEFRAPKSYLRLLYFFVARKGQPINGATAGRDATPGADAMLIFLLTTTFITAVGLVCSYSRGAWLGTFVGLLYLAGSYGRLKWPYVISFCALLAAPVLLFWNDTPDSAPWYIKRLDFERPSAQHRVAAWKAGFEIMRDHPFGVGWNGVPEIYQQSYSPPEGGAAAITTNDYLMLGTQLGITGLICFAAYAALCFRKIGSQGFDFPIKAACHAGALAMLAAFWFDGGLFKLPTAAVFWVLLELGRGDNRPSGHFGAAVLPINNAPLL